MTDTALKALIGAIAAGDEALALSMLGTTPALARAALTSGACRQSAGDHYIDEIAHYAYAGDTALHLAAAAYRRDVAQRLVGLGADIRARNRRGAEPLHYAADGLPGSRGWNPAAQAAIVTWLIAAGADPNAMDGSGVAPLHRAVRTRCASAVAALLEGGANPLGRNKGGSTPTMLALANTGRGGSGTAAAKAEQVKIVQLLQKHIAERN
jgi:ankyrin repeat protein